MVASSVLTGIAILLVVATIWQDLVARNCLTHRAKTQLLIASIFAVTNLVISFTN